MTFCANSIVVGRTVLMPACPTGCAQGARGRRLRRSCSSTSREFHKGGGSVRCLTNPLDVMLGRDLRARPAVDEVLLPR